MARIKNITHSDDCCTIRIEGNKAKPEPSTVVVAFPGGNIEVSRTSTGTYWAHITIADTDFDPAIERENRGKIVGSRINRVGMKVENFTDPGPITSIAIEVEAFTYP